MAMRHRGPGVTYSELEGDEEPEVRVRKPTKAPEMELMDEIVLIFAHNPVALVVAFAAGAGLAYLGIWCLLPPKMCRKFPFTFWAARLFSL